MVQRKVIDVGETLFWVLLVVSALAAAVFLAVIGYLYWWQIARAQPRLDGETRLVGLNDPVEIWRDKHGVPHIYARTKADMLRAQGYVHAQDRLWQMEQNRRIASGRLAEIFGEAALEADRFSRTVGFRRAAEAEFARLDEETKAALLWYCEGVNAYLAARRGRVAPELNVLRVEPEEWLPLDTLAYAKLMGWGLSVNWESELTRLRLLLRGDAYRVAELEPDQPTGTPFITEATGGAQQERLLHVAGLLLNYLEPLKQWIGGIQGGQGSNSWVIAPKHSLTRKPILCNDPHLVAQIPGVWYELHMACPEIEVAGACFAGIPGVVIGHNDDIAWGLTNGAVDQQDLYIEKEHPRQAAHFEYAGQWESATVIEETIVVRRQAQPHVERVVITRHGPVITNLLPQAERAGLPALSVRWTGYEADNEAGDGRGCVLRAVLRMNAAQSPEDLREALRDWDTPSQNVVWADVRGNVGYQLAGRVPRRSDGVGLVPAPGWTGAHEWRGFVPFEELPFVENPESGKIVTANNKPVGDEYPHFLGVEFDPGWRAQRIEELLAERERYSVRDMEEIQLDTVSKYAGALVRWLVLLNSEEPWEKVSIQALRKWNLRMDVDSHPALVFHFVLIELLTMVFGDKLGPVRDGYLGGSVTPLFPFSSHADRAQQKLLELLNNEEFSLWYVDAQSGQRRSREELLQTALTRAVRRVRDTVGDSTLKWHWGRLHQLSYVHPLGSARLLRNLFNRGPIPVGGDNTTILQTRYTPAFPLGMVQVLPSYRQIIEVGSWDHMQSVTSTGQSGHPLSPNYDDQMVMWREGVYHLMPWTREAVERLAVNKVLLRPGGTA